ncbi:MAG: cytochrome c oxidase subunit II [Solirubrobacterales bacterium]
MPEPNHFRRVMVLWLALSVVATPIVVLVAAPGLPPGKATTEASSQVTDNTVLLGIATPITALIVVYFAYALIVFRHRDPEPDEGVAIRGNNRVVVTWLVVTSTIVVFAAAYGTARLFAGTGSGGGQGSSPIAKPSGGAQLQVQVIGQQWNWTYRFPSFGGVETSSLELPVDKDVELHVTSLDVIHSFWARQLGVKADANPGVDNVAYVHPTKVQSFDIRCAELCGLFHGHMFQTGHVVSDGAFQAWIKRQQRLFAPATRNLNPYNPSYLPHPERRAG